MRELNRDLWMIRVRVLTSVCRAQGIIVGTAVAEDALRRHGRLSDAFAAIISGCGFLSRLARPILKRAFALEAVGRRGSSTRRS